jgi:hypothetical protein
MLLAVIAFCEIAFWVVLGLGLLARYVLRWPRVSTALLIGVPLLDLVLVVATVIDLRDGGTANFTHGLAAAYLGFSVAFGRDLVRWADVRFAHRFAGGPPPVKIPGNGPVRVRYEWVSWGKGMIGWAVACGLLLGGVLWIDDPARTQALLGWTFRLSTAMVVWLIFWPVWVTLTPARRYSSDSASSPGSVDPAGIADAIEPAITRSSSSSSGTGRENR